MQKRYSFLCVLGVLTGAFIGPANADDAQQGQAQQNAEAQRNNQNPPQAQQRQFQQGQRVVPPNIPQPKLPE